MLGSLFPYLKKTSILPSKPPSDITSSRVNPFWSHSYALNIFSLLHLSHLSYKAKVTQLLRMYEGWVPGLPASRAMPFLLCWGGGLRKSSAYWPIKGSTYVEQLYKNELILKKRRLYEPMCPCWRQVHIYMWMHEQVWKECEDKNIYTINSFSKRTQWNFSSLSNSFTYTGNYVLAYSYVAVEIATKIQVYISIFPCFYLPIVKSKVHKMPVVSVNVTAYIKGRNSFEQNKVTALSSI